MVSTPTLQDLYLDTANRLGHAGIESPRLESQILIGLALGLTRVQILSGQEHSLSTQQIDAVNSLLVRRLRREPLAYIRGTQEFYGATFEVNPFVLIPRPETELLVDFALSFAGDGQPLSFADCGTGSGCIAISVLLNKRDARSIGVDASAEALRVAQRNGERLGVSNRAAWIRGNMLDSLADCGCDLILSNPPYIPSAEIHGLQPEVREYEPRVALDGGEDGCRFHRELAIGAKRVLKCGGALAIEVAADQADTVAGIMAESGFSAVGVEPDLAGIDRLVYGYATHRTPSPTIHR